ncbi:P-loop containing nucleoside triphosphate hydrolase protein [Lentinula detonsa]|uniref:P-loop containing nucleoside triphosphate hydrolase protein n=1 Tax=Lentinula detonsa TaxID=2804962 RepID=A0A9W8NTC8_9AGAR|nr:P-loop containing nucleoside triphosphate hydrolase protein [Lentinula detonsa]
MAQISDNIYIAIMGGTGTGKTSFTNLIGGSRFLVGNGLESCTKHIQTHKFIFEGHNITLIDVPGFDDTNESDADILKMIADFLASEYKAGRQLSGIMYLHRISDVRMGGASKRNFVMFEKLCGQDAFMNVAIVTTRWDQEEELVGRARLEELKTKPQLYKPVLDGGGAIFRHEQTRESAAAILTHFIAKASKPLLIQYEMVEEHKKVSETAAGKELEQEILKQVERHQKEMEELLGELKQNRDTSELEELEAECKSLQEQAMHWQGEARKLANSESTSPTALDQDSKAGSNSLLAQTLHVAATPNLLADSDKDRDRLDPNRERARAKVEGAVKYLLDMITTVLYTVDSLRREVVGGNGGRDHYR